MPDKVGAPSGAPDGQIDRNGAAEARGGTAEARGGATQGPPPETYRSPLALVAWWVWLAFAVANLIDIAVQGRDRLSLEAAAALVLVTGIMYVGALRPRVIATARGIVVRNPLRDHRVPWTSVSNVDVGDLLRVHCAWPEPGPESGPNKGQGQQAVQRPENVQRTRVVQAWALQAPRRAGMRSPVSRYELARRSVGGAAAAAEPPRALHRKETERIARALSERARRQRADAMAARPGAAGGGAAGGGAADGPSPAGSLANGGVTGGVTGRPEWAPRPVSAWHWPSVLAIAVPALLLVAAILA